MLNVGDVDFSSVVNKCTTNLLNSCESYVSSEFAFDKIVKNKIIQVIIPFIIIILSIIVLKPRWSIKKDSEDRNYVKIIIMSISIYILAIFTILSVKAIFTKY